MIGGLASTCHALTVATLPGALVAAPAMPRPPGRAPLIGAPHQRRQRPDLGAVLLLAALGFMASSGEGASAETCRFAGTTDYAGHVAATTEVTRSGDTTRVDVAVTFESTTMLFLGVHYLLEEVSTWRAGQLESVAVNSRYLIGDHIVRQQWDEFQRDAGGLQAHRVQAKTLDDFRVRHPGFVRHWDPATFAQPWLRDYPSASPERRIDLDLRASPLPSGLRSPLAMAFYWVRWLRHGSQQVTVFLPGFKRDRLVSLSASSAETQSGTLWQAPLHYPALSDSPASTATALISADGHLMQIAFELFTPRGSGRGTITQQGCEGAAVFPVGRQQ
jgi:hypothetical protein